LEPCRSSVVPWMNLVNFWWVLFAIFFCPFFLFAWWLALFIWISSWCIPQ
jgi:hypothetical protein